MPNVLSPRDLVSRPDNMDKTVLYKIGMIELFTELAVEQYCYESSIISQPGANG